MLRVSLPSSDWRANAEHVASGSAFWWQRRAMLSDDLTRERRDWSAVGQFSGLIVVWFRRDCLSVRRAIGAELLLQLSLELFDAFLGAFFLPSQNGYSGS